MLPEELIPFLAFDRKMITSKKMKRIGTREKFSTDGRPPSKFRDLGKKLIKGARSATEFFDGGIVGSSISMDKFMAENSNAYRLSKPGDSLDLEFTEDWTSIAQSDVAEDGQCTRLEALVRAGDSYFGVYRLMTDGSTDLHSGDSIGVCELSLGHNKLYAGDENDLVPSRDLGDVQPKRVRNHLVDGKVQNWKAIKVGHNHFNPDPRLDEHHFDLEVDGYGRLRLINYSPNGVKVVTGGTILETLKKDKVLPTDTERLLAHLQEYPSKFDPRSLSK